MNKTSKNRLIIMLSLVAIVLAILVVFQLSKAPKDEYDSDSETTFHDGETVMFLGGGNAENEILLLFDYACPWCTVWVEEILPSLKKHIDAGHTKFRTQSLALLNPMSLKLAEVDQNLKVHYGNEYFAFFKDLIHDSSQTEITEADLKNLANEHGLDIDVLLGNTDLNMTLLTDEYVEGFDVESVPTVIVNGKKIEDPFNVEAIEAQLVGEK